MTITLDSTDYRPRPFDLFVDCDGSPLTRSFSDRLPVAGDLLIIFGSIFIVNRSVAGCQRGQFQLDATAL